MSGTSAPLIKLRAWISKVNNTIYQADTDGLAIARAATSIDVQIFTDANNPPTVERSFFGAAASGAVGFAISLVIKGNYWKAVGGTQYVYWLPFY